jgi:nucleoside 2-deoxyribosyltransferase
MKRPFVFVIMSFAPEFADVYELGIKPACEAANVDCARVDEQIFLESILERIYGETERADIVVAEMTGRNPNVFYETGYAHGLGRPVILLTKSADDIPFDLRQYPHVVYGNRIATLKRELQKRLVALTADPKKAMAVSMRTEQRARAQLDRMAAHIENYFNAKKCKWVSFDRIRRNINEDYTDDILRRLIDERPEKFRRVVIKGNRPGIGRVSV